MTSDDFPDLDIIGPETYARSGYPHAAWQQLRREAPVCYWTKGVMNPFWAITKHADVIWLSKQPRRFLNAPRLAVLPGAGGNAQGPQIARQLLNMDPPEHGQFRKLASSWFTPRAIARRAPEIERITHDLLDGLRERGAEGNADFVGDLVAPLTLSVLADMLGVPREDWRRMFEWTNQVAGSADPEYQQAGETPIETVQRARTSLFGYFAELAKQRAAAPRDDITSVLVAARLDGKPLPPFELLSYFFLLVIAGNETTRNAASGALLAFVENPGEWVKLVRGPELLDSAVEEIVRWTAPVIQFCRTPVEDFELRGQKIRAGDSMCLFYPSANRDEEVFPDGDRFRVDRSPNPHLGFGVGEHFCLGANLARLELRVLVRQLAARLESVELAGPVERVRSSFLGGIKRMPIRYRLRA